jgi:hypothetical protein
MSLPNLCSRLVVTRIRWNTPFPSFRLSPFRPPRPAPRFRPSQRPRFHALPSTTAPNSRCRHLRPWVVTQLVLRLQPLPASPPRRVARCPELLARAGVLSRTRARRADSQAPPVALSFLPWHPRFSSKGPGPLSRAVHQDRTRVAGPRRLPPAGPIDRAPRLRSEHSFPGRHWYPGFAANSPASDMLSRSAPPSARPKPLAGFHRSAWATCRLPTSATERSPNTPTNCPNPVACCSGEPLREQVATPLAKPHQPSCLRPGVALAFGPFDPHHADRSAQWIYPNLIGSGTPCHDPVSGSA